MDREYEAIVRRRNRNRRPPPNEIDRIVNETFHIWFSSHVQNMGNDISKELRWLAKGPNIVAKQFDSYSINGFKFRTKGCEEFLKSQNSGVVVTAKTTSYASVRDQNPVAGDVTYYGRTKNIVELDYYGVFKVLLFKCDWVDTTIGTGLKKDAFGFTLVNFKCLVHTGEHIRHEPFILASQAKLVYYVEDLRDSDWCVVVHVKPRDLFDMGNVDSQNEKETYSENEPYHSQSVESIFKDNGESSSLE
ncbi:uncharacterized protein LOC119999044 [Tripterygium wilfordii]|uniref:uncharacterized protein LOC119999044 n=1 Tax=Tripterygium wilfordii TaxID=458696 RepID=UPI0018F81E1C|nr:uncharacterized protein LOC119999044 [Tripterygium wilfordii]